MRSTVNTLRSYFRWEWEVLKQFYGDVLQRTGLKSVLIEAGFIILVAIVSLFTSPDDEVSMSAVASAAQNGLIAGGLLLGLFVLYQLALAPYRLYGRFTAIEDLDVVFGAEPRFYQFTPSENRSLYYIVLRNVTIINRHDSPVSLEWKLRFNYGDGDSSGASDQAGEAVNPAIEVGEPEREAFGPWERKKGQSVFGATEILTPPADFPRPGSRNGYIVFVINEFTKDLIVQDGQVVPSNLELVLFERQTDRSKEFVIDRPLVVSDSVRRVNDR